MSLRERINTLQLYFQVFLTLCPASGMKLAHLTTDSQHSSSSDFEREQFELPHVIGTEKCCWNTLTLTFPTACRKTPSIGFSKHWSWPEVMGSHWLFLVLRAAGTNLYLIIKKTICTPPHFFLKAKEKERKITLSRFRSKYFILSIPPLVRMMINSD